jgi:hypothetical protein
MNLLKRYLFANLCLLIFWILSFFVEGALIALVYIIALIAMVSGTFYFTEGHGKSDHIHMPFL